LGFDRKDSPTRTPASRRHHGLTAVRRNIQFVTTDQQRHDALVATAPRSAS